MDQRECAYQYLTEVAFKGKTITYYELAAQIGVDLTKPGEYQKLMQILDDIAYRENAQGHPLLTAIVVRPETPYPGKGFFLLARELGFNQFDDERSYYHYELQKVFKFWKQHFQLQHSLPYMVAGNYEVRVIDNGSDGGDHREFKKKFQRQAVR